MKRRMKKNNIYKDIFMMHNERDVLCYVTFMQNTREIRCLDRRNFYARSICLTCDVYEML